MKKRSQPIRLRKATAAAQIRCVSKICDCVSSRRAVKRSAWLKRGSDTSLPCDTGEQFVKPSAGTVDKQRQQANPNREVMTLHAAVVSPSVSQLWLPLNSIPVAGIV